MSHRDELAEVEAFPVNGFHRPEISLRPLLGFYRKGHVRAVYHFGSERAAELYVAKRIGSIRRLSLSVAIATLLRASTQVCAGSAGTGPLPLTPA
jgi:hypothetical protein